MRSSTSKMRLLSYFLFLFSPDHFDFFCFPFPQDAFNMSLWPIAQYFLGLVATLIAGLVPGWVYRLSQRTSSRLVKLLAAPYYPT